MDKKLTDAEKDTIKKYNNNTHTKELVRQLEDDMINAFTWESTEEGHDYWADVQKRLNRIAEVGF